MASGTDLPTESELLTPTLDAGPPSPAPPLPGPAIEVVPPGTLIGDYRVECALGSGGMGAVYGAVHTVIGKRAAIKVLHRALCQEPELVQRFIQEARTVNKIHHPNIVDIFDFGELSDGRRYLAMDWLQGQTLGARLRRGPLGAEGADILDQIIDALQAAHDARVVHRDLKPDNVFLSPTPSGASHVTLLDFGLAKLEERNLAQTQSGNLIGTPGYLSPEQARGKKVDHRTDIYALGCIAFEIFTGRMPFQAETAADAIVAHLTTPPPLASMVLPGLPHELDRLLVAMMAKQPGERPPLTEVRRALFDLRGRLGERTMLSSQPGAAPLALLETARHAVPQVAPAAPAAPPRRRWPLVVGAGLLLAVGGLMGWQWPRKPVVAPPPPPPVTEPAAPAVPVASEPGPVPAAVPLAADAGVVDAGAPDAAPQAPPRRKRGHAAAPPAPVVSEPPPPEPPRADDRLKGLKRKL